MIHKLTVVFLIVLLLSPTLSQPNNNAANDQGDLEAAQLRVQEHNPGIAIPRIPNPWWCIRYYCWCIVLACQQDPECNQAIYACIFSNQNFWECICQSGISRLLGNCVRRCFGQYGCPYYRIEVKDEFIQKVAQDIQAQQAQP